MLYVIFYFVIWHSIINSKLLNSTNVLNSSKEIWNDCIKWVFISLVIIWLLLLFFFIALNFSKISSAGASQSCMVSSQVITSLSMSIISWMLAPKTFHEHQNQLRNRHHCYIPKTSSRLPPKSSCVRVPFSKR